MTKRDNVISALSHRTINTVPHQLDLTRQVHKRLTIYYNDEDFLYNVADNFLVREKYKNHRYNQDNIYYTDVFGVKWFLQNDGGDIGTIKDYIYKEPNMKLYKFDEPDHTLIKAACERISSLDGLFKVYEIPFSLFERAWTLRGMENILSDMLLEETFVHDLLNNILEYDLKIIDTASRFPIDAIMLGDDWGAQRGLIMGKRLWSKYIKPRLKILYDKIHSKRLYVFQHSCGDNSELFSDFIELGLDVYNTFQPEIYDIQKIKNEYGSDITIYGGISTQGILTHGTSSEVYECVRRTISILGENGGYITAPTHQITYDVSNENIDAFLKAVKI